MLHHSLRRVLFYHHANPYRARIITRYLGSKALGGLTGQHPLNSVLFTRTIVDLSLSKIVNGTGDTGVNIDPFGQLEIVSEERSLRRQKTALVLSRASQSLTKYDFLRVLGPDLGRGCPDQPEEVFPVRHHRNLQRCNSWVLIFTSPAEAKRYQNRVATLRSFAAEHAQKRASITTIYSPPNLGGNRALWGFKRNDYTLTSPFQSLSLVAKLSPFDRKLRQAINTQANLLSSRRDGQQSFQVRLWVDVSKYPILNLRAIEELLELDGFSRGSIWPLSSHRGAIVSASQDPATQTSQESCQNLEGQSSATSTDNWLINFACVSASKRFVRLWHRRRLPRLDSLYYYNCHLIVKTESLL
ncbi:hypothetical protein Egran_01363 [Elaphomyces granulatus]|uniref:Uncharacterized protein n=1 Tax=Elaphomyces granulatus TaxID=519963 RepID=A0A232M393_9EURO|nr:hypothetical protein Egran_01363 [Elaphomyces granulatus]